MYTFDLLTFNIYGTRISIINDIDQVNNMITAYELKKDYIANDPNQNALAKENGWFNRINYELSLLYKRKEVLQ